MGTIRTLLALCIVVYHSYTIFGERLTGGMVAVQAFYVISGFYMALILNEKYKPGPGSFRLFITNRFLRIYPAYWVCLFLSVLMCVAGMTWWNNSFYLGYWTSQWENLHWTAIVFFILANVLIFGSDWLLFSGVSRETGRLELAPQMQSYSPMAFQFLFIPQIWSVGVELSFYLLAPFLLRTKWFVQAGVLVASLLLRVVLTHEKLWIDPWSYRFFPTELALFMGGSLAYKLYVYLREKPIPRWVNGMFWITVIGLVVSYPHVMMGNPLHFRWYFYTFFALSLPFIFLFSRSSHLDRVIGELSYPIYICHHFIMFLWRGYFFSHPLQMKWFGIACVLSSLVAAVILYRGVIVPLEKIRQRRVEKAAALA